MKQGHSVAEGFYRLLFGGLSPKAVLERYEHTDDELFDTLWEIPRSPEEYMATTLAIKERWHSFSTLDVDINSDLDVDRWVPPFYCIPDDVFRPFHLLCKFYRSWIWCEGRMIMGLVTVWVQKLEMSLLQFELVTLQERLISLLRECDERLAVNREDADRLLEKLERYMLQLLWNQLLMLLMELVDRYEQLLDGRGHTLEEIFVKQLNKPLPGQFVWYRTQSFYDFHLEKSLRSSVNLQQIEELLKRAREERDNLRRVSDEENMAVSVRRLENVLLCYVMAVETEQLEYHDLLDTEKNVLRINNWNKVLDDEQPRDDSFKLHHLLVRMGYLRKHIALESGSEAASLLQKLESIFDPPEGSHVNHSVEEPAAVPAVSEHWALNEYIAYREILNKLNVHNDTLTKYLKESGVSVIKISQKNKWLHVDDFHKFMQAHKS